MGGGHRPFHFLLANSFVIPPHPPPPYIFSLPPPFAFPSHPLPVLPPLLPHPRRHLYLQCYYVLSQKGHQLIIPSFPAPALDTPVPLTPYTHPVPPHALSSSAPLSLSPSRPPPTEPARACLAYWGGRLHVAFLYFRVGWVRVLGFSFPLFSLSLFVFGFYLFFFLYISNSIGPYLSFSMSYLSFSLSYLSFSVFPFPSFLYSLLPFFFPFLFRLLRLIRFFFL